MTDLRLDAYVRVSRVGGRAGESFISPEVQREQIEAWAQVMGAKIGEWHTDLDQSGGTMSRPAFQRAYERVLRGETGGIVVAKIDRFARSAADAGQIVREIMAAGGVFASAAERIDPTTPFGKFGLTIMLVMAELELDRIKESWSEAEERAIARGVHFQAPFGYGRAKDGRLVPNADARLVREVFRRRAAGASWGELAAWLNERSAPANAKRWTGHTVTHLIRRRAYLGEAHHGVHVNPHAHKPLVTPEVWHAAQRRVSGRANRGDGGLLSGLVRCAACRYSIKHDRTGPADARVRQYRCRGHHGAGDCPAPASMVADKLERYVVSEFGRHLGQLAGSLVVSVPEVQAARQRLEEAEGELTGYRDDLRIRSLLGHDAYVAGLEVRVQAVRAAESALAEAQAGSSVPELP